jgi:hypothetical protein
VDDQEPLLGVEELHRHRVAGWSASVPPGAILGHHRDAEEAR